MNLNHPDHLIKDKCPIMLCRTSLGFLKWTNAQCNRTSKSKFLLPAGYKDFSHTFTTSSSQSSYVGRAPISIPPSVKFHIECPAKKKKVLASSIASQSKAVVEGPLGKLALPLPHFVKITHDEINRKLFVSITDKELKSQRAMWVLTIKQGTVRSYLNNYIIGVSEGHTVILRLVGVGYRAMIEKTAITVQPEFKGQEFISLKVGYSHPIELPIPKNVKASAPQPTRILLEGPDKEVISQMAAKLRMYRKPEPYKGKGIFVDGETIKLKSKKIK